MNDLNDTIRDRIKELRADGVLYGTIREKIFEEHGVSVGLTTVYRVVNGKNFKKIIRKVKLSIFIAEMKNG